jgi:hypothetical protein
VTNNKVGDKRNYIYDGGSAAQAAKSDMSDYTQQ